MFDASDCKFSGSMDGMLVIVCTFSQIHAQNIVSRAGAAVVVNPSQAAVSDAGCHDLRVLAALQCCR